jgi:hypothetical protein
MTTSKRYDEILWIPDDADYTRLAAGLGRLIHPCRTSVVPALVFREQLDYMALGTCRLCGEPMPTMPEEHLGEGEG